MATALEALKQAVEFERSALEQYQIAMDQTQHDETKEALKGYIEDKQQKIDTLSWFVMAETGTLEVSGSLSDNSGSTNGRSRSHRGASARQSLVLGQS